MYAATAEAGWSLHRDGTSPYADSCEAAQEGALLAVILAEPLGLLVLALNVVHLGSKATRSRGGRTEGAPYWTMPAPTWESSVE